VTQSHLKEQGNVESSTYFRAGPQEKFVNEKQEVESLTGMANDTAFWGCGMKPWMSKLVSYLMLTEQKV
jgi:hypothetical protein